jgi:cytidylate kinase
VTIIVAIDGPAGGGKSSVSREVAKRVGFGYLDTGAAYRALTWWALDRHLEPGDTEAIAGLLADFPYQISLDPNLAAVSVGGADITEAIREPRISLLVSFVAGNSKVREWMRDNARGLVAKSGMLGVVAEGRDLTTVVFPDADSRILLTASESVRISRRANEPFSGSIAETVTSVSDRDKKDSTVADFMKPAPGVTLVDSSEMDIEQTVDAVIKAMALDGVGSHA